MFVPYSVMMTEHKPKRVIKAERKEEAKEFIEVASKVDEIKDESSNEKTVPIDDVVSQSSEKQVSKGSSTTLLDETEKSEEK